VAFTVVVFGGLFLYSRYTSMPPKEVKLIQDFNEHRAAFEQLRDMLLADEQILRVANWGVETRKGIRVPPEGNFPLNRYNQYLALLKQVGGLVANRDEGEHPDPGVLVWGYGFGGDTKHLGISWEDQEPTNQVASLDDHFRKRMHGEEWRVVYRHIDGNWYLWTDW
jgi:hypothetical protein